MSPKVKELIEKCFPIAEDDHIELPNGTSLNDILKNDLPEIMEEYARYRVDLCCKDVQPTSEANTVKLFLNILVNNNLIMLEVKPEEAKQYEELGWLAGQVTGEAKIWLCRHILFEDRRIISGL